MRERESVREREGEQESVRKISLARETSVNACVDVCVWLRVCVPAYVFV